MTYLTFSCDGDHHSHKRSRTITDYQDQMTSSAADTWVRRCWWSRDRAEVRVGRCWYPLQSGLVGPPADAVSVAVPEPLRYDLP